MQIFLKVYSELIRLRRKMQSHFWNDMAWTVYTQIATRFILSNIKNVYRPVQLQDLRRPKQIASLTTINLRHVKDESHAFQ